MNSRATRLLKLLIPLLLGVGLVWYSLSKISIVQLVQYLKNIHYSWLFLGLFCGFLSHMSRAYRWYYLLEPLGYKPKFLNSIMAVFSGYLINYTIPRAGDISRATVLANYEKIPFQKVLGTIVSERVADLIMLFLILMWTLVLKFNFIYEYVFEKFNILKIVLLLGVAIVGFIALVAYVKISKSKIALKVKNFISGLFEGVLSIVKMKKKWAFLAHTLFIWFMYILMFYITSLAVNELQGIPFSAILTGFVAASFSIAATNGGVGSYPEAVVLAFTLFSISEDPSRAFGWIVWLSQTLAVVLLGGTSLLYLPFYNRKSTHGVK